MNQALSASIIINNKNNTWMNDNLVHTCHKCNVEFGMFIRKHHCRNCGNIFCFACSNYYCTIPPFILDIPEPEDYWNISHYIKKNNDEEVRVCHSCYININKKIESDQIIGQLFENLVPYDEMTKHNLETRTHYYDHLRNIQYYLPNHTYNDIDKKILYTNSQFFCKHSKYLMHYIKSIVWEKKLNNKKLNNVMGIINGNKNKTCDELFCTRTCQEVLSCDDCISILYSITDDMPKEIVVYLFKIIMKTPSLIILCHLPFFINLIKNNNRLFLDDDLFSLVSKSDKLKHQIIWYLLFSKDKCSDLQISNINRFILKFDATYFLTIQREFTLFTNIIDNLHCPNKILTDYFSVYNYLTLPYDPLVKLTGVDYNNIVVKSSKTKPVVIPFITESNTKIHLLFKKENVMNDVAVLNLIQLSNIILEEHLKQDFNSTTYSVMPINNDAGIIQLVFNAETIYNIEKNNKNIIQYIVEKNEYECFSTIADRYTSSLIAYTLQSYFIGLGDRHLQNIMIHDSGSIFHIDFGYILGTDTYPLTTSDIKLNNDMLNILGNKDDIRYNRYIGTCSNGFVLLRKYFNMFFVLFSVSTDFDEKYIEKFIMSRFQPRQSDKVVVDDFVSIINKSNNSFYAHLRDLVHYHTQEKTVQTSIANIFHSAISLIIKR